MVRLTHPPSENELRTLLAIVGFTCVVVGVAGVPVLKVHTSLEIVSLQLRFRNLTDVPGKVK